MHLIPFEENQILENCFVYFCSTTFLLPLCVSIKNFSSNLFTVSTVTLNIVMSILLDVI